MATLALAAAVLAQSNIGVGATLLQTIIKALALGSVYAIMGLGFVLIFKGTQVLNFAQGAIAMAGALFLSILISDGGIPFLPFKNPFAPGNGESASIAQWLINLAFALLLAALLGLVLERLAIRPMVVQPLFAMAIVTLGLEFAIRPFNADATAITGRSLGVPWKAESWTVAGAIVPKSYVAAMIFALISGVAVLVFYRSKLGIAMRAVAFDQEAAMAQGIKVGRVFGISWAFGSALAALSAITYGMAPFPPGGTVSPELHPILAFRVLPVIVLGGLDSINGTIYAAFLVATAEVFAGQYLSQWNDVLGSGYSTLVPYIVMLGVLLVRPYGLFGTAEVRRV